MVTAAYYGLSGLMLVLVIAGFYKALTKSGLAEEAQTKQFRSLLMGLTGWFIYLTILSNREVLHDSSLPPRVLLFLFIPFVIGLIIYYRKNKDNEALHAMPKTWPVYAQTFRIVVETLLLYTFYKGIIPILATFEGLNFDILMGISAPFVGYFVYSNISKNKTLAKGWNILSIGMILFVALIIATANYFPAAWGAEKALVDPAFFSLPYLLVAGFLAPLGIFMHVVSLIQLRRVK